MDDVEENHHYMAPKYINPRELIPLMTRKLQEYFSALYLERNFEMSTPHNDLKLFEEIKQTIYPKIFNIWWGQKKDEFKGPILASLPFTFVDWKTAELCRDGKFDIKELTFT
jgi:hypothetical protein